MKVPASLYKYASLQRVRHLRDIIIDSRIYFASPLDFNDPFDCKPRFMIGVTEDQLRRTRVGAADMLAEYSALDEVSRKAVTEFVLATHTPDQIEKEFQRCFTHRGVCCLAGKNDNPLMWSHYADSHRGVCLQFSTEPSGSFFSHALPVKYSDAYPIIEAYAFDAPDWGSAAFLTKSLDWEYEQEWRLLANLSGYLVFPGELLTGVILGCRTAEKDVELIKGWIVERGKCVRVWKAIMNERQFRLDIADV